MSILDDVKKETQNVRVEIEVKIDSELNDMIEIICKENGIKKDDYLSAIIKNSEIEKVFKLGEKTRKQNAKKASVSGDNN